MTRKIEADMLRAIYYAKEWKNSNTHTEVDGLTVRVFLHGHLIASLQTPQPGHRTMTLYWGTSMHFSRTTFSRQNAILRQLVGNEARVFTKAHEPMLSARFGGVRPLEVGDAVEFSI